EEVPPVATTGKATLRITVIEDRSIFASVDVADVKATAVHIHEGAPGKTGDPILTFSPRGVGTWLLPTGAKLTEAQLKSMRAGRTYINVHSEKHPDGELRAQIKP